MIASIGILAAGCVLIAHSSAVRSQTLLFGGFIVCGIAVIAGAVEIYQVIQ